jgi:hypothetical protein
MRKSAPKICVTKFCAPKFARQNLRAKICAPKFARQKEGRAITKVMAVSNYEF